MRSIKYNHLQLQLRAPMASQRKWSRALINKSCHKRPTDTLIWIILRNICLGSRDRMTLSPPRGQINTILWKRPQQSKATSATKTVDFVFCRNRYSHRFDSEVVSLPLFRVCVGMTVGSSPRVGERIQNQFWISSLFRRQRSESPVLSIYTNTRLANTHKHTHTTICSPTNQLTVRIWNSFFQCLGWTSCLLTACDSPLLPGEAPGCLMARWEND